MKVILLERVGRTGSIGDEVSVKDGFARNFLLPQGKALRRKPTARSSNPNAPISKSATTTAAMRPPALPKASMAAKW